MSDHSMGPLSESVLANDSTSSGTSLPADRPEQIGVYKILELIGEGGMGEVYKAERHEPIRQTVALKVVKLGLNSRQVVGRFEAERQTLAILDHPGIARVLDAGTTTTGRPYFVMDFVAGKPITVFCDENRLSISERLKLFALVCDAIGHAHTKAIIHRDVKASNVLAYFQDGVPAVKVIDFGIAKAIGGDRALDQTIYTAYGQAIGTYDSMSPEQAAGSPDIDTRTDVYSLGVLLYELLTGAKPFDQATLARAADAEVKRIIREVEPPRPSTRLSNLGESATAFADRRQVKPDALASQLRSELEWIPLKAMRKERGRRYASSLQFKEDIENYLSGKPLLAGPETRSYRVQKFIKRNRAGVTSSAVATLGVLGGAVLYIHNIRAEQARTQSALIESEHQRSEAKRQEQIAMQQRSVAEKTRDFLAGMLETADPDQLLGDKVTVVQALHVAVDQLNKGSLKDQPAVESSLRSTIAKTLFSLGHYQEALENYQRMLDLDRAMLAPTDSRICDALNAIAAMHQQLGNLDEAAKLFGESLSLARQANPVNPTTLQSCLNDLGNLTGDESMLLEALTVGRAIRPVDDLDVATTLNNLANLYSAKGQFDKALAVANEALVIRRAAYPPTHPMIANAVGTLAYVQIMQKNYADAETLLRESLAIRRQTLPANHPDTAIALVNLSATLQYQKKYAEAEEVAREALAMRRATLPDGHPDIATSVGALGILMKLQNRLDDAESLFRESLSLRRAALPAGHSSIIDSVYQLGLVLRDEGKFAEAEPLLREGLESRLATDGKTGTRTVTFATALARLYDKSDRSNDAEAIRKEYNVPVRTTRPATTSATTPAKP